jgi:hypothetical protein
MNVNNQPMANGNYVLNVHNGHCSWVRASIALSTVLEKEQYEKTNSTKWLFISALQSNTVGTTPNDAIDWSQDAPDPRIFQFNRNKNNLNYTPVNAAQAPFIPFQYPAQNGYIMPNDNQICHQLSFSKKFLATRPNDEIYWVLCAVGGICLSVNDVGGGPMSWSPDFKNGRNLTNEMIEDVQYAQQLIPDAVLGGVVGIGGESDHTFTTSQWQIKFSETVAVWRSRLSAPNLPIIIGTMLSSFVGISPAMQRVDVAHRRIKDYMWLAGCADIALVETGVMSDLVHYNAATQRAAGKLLYDVWFEVWDEYLAALEKWKAAN